MKTSLTSGLAATVLGLALASPVIPEPAPALPVPGPAQSTEGCVFYFDWNALQAGCADACESGNCPGPITIRWGSTLTKSCTGMCGSGNSCNGSATFSGGEITLNCSEADCGGACDLTDPFGDGVDLCLCGGG